MRKITSMVFAILALATFLLAQDSNSAGKMDHECLKCHKLSKEEAVKMLSEVIPDANIIEVGASPVKGLWEIALEKNGQKGIVYADFSGHFIVSGGMFDLKTKANLTQERLSSLNKVDVSQIPLDDALVMGKKDAKHRVIVFSDPD